MPSTASQRRGRRSYYQPDFAEQAYRFALLGLTDAQMAEAFFVSESCLKLWRKRHPELADAVARGKAAADAKVAEALYKRAVGQDITRERWERDDDGELVLVERTKELLPADVNAAKFWLGNRDRSRWRNGDGPGAVAVAGAVAGSSTIAGISDELLEQIRNAPEAPHVLPEPASA